MSSAKNVIALALTWDGSRWPSGSLPPSARAFLRKKAALLPNATAMAKLFARDQVREIRLCWVPRLSGGDNVLSASFPTSNGKRLRFRATSKTRFGDILGVIYRRDTKQK
jgi:hypothetical protein